MRKLRKNNAAFKFLIKIWSKHCVLSEKHRAWALKNVLVSNGLRKGELLYFRGDSAKNIFLVTKGAIARTCEDEDGKRMIYNVAFAGMSLLTTRHLYSHTAIQNDIEVLHAGTEVLKISYTSLFKFREEEREVDILISMMANKEKKQRDSLLVISRTKNPFKRGLRLAEDLPEVFYSLSQDEIAHLLDVSRSTVQSVYRSLVGRK